MSDAVAIMTGAKTPPEAAMAANVAWSDKMLSAATASID